MKDEIFTIALNSDDRLYVFYPTEFYHELRIIYYMKRLSIILKIAFLHSLLPF